MKSRLSYKSKRNIVIAIIIIALLAIISTAAYIFVKGNKDTTAAFTENKTSESEQSNQEGKAEENSQNPEENQTQNTEGNQEQNTEGNQEQNNNEQENQNVNNNQETENGNGTENTVEQNGNTQNNGTGNTTGNTTGNVTTGTTTGEVPNQEYVTERIEEQEYLVSENYAVGWAPLKIKATTTTSDLEIIRPIISAVKETNKETVVEGEEIEYTIRVTNSGKIAGTAIIKDYAPIDDETTEEKETANTTFVEKSIKVNGKLVTKVVEEETIPLEEQDLKDGIEVEVPANGETTLSFTVKVNEGETGTVNNTAIVNDTVRDIPTNEVKNPIVTHIKQVDKATTTAGVELTYTIIVTNTGDIDGKAIVKDSVPEGTTFIEESIEINGEPATKIVEEETIPLEEQDLENGIEVEVPANNGTVTVSFKVTTLDLENGTIINNTAKVNEKETEEPTETIYYEPIITAVKATNKGTVAGGEEIEYTITLTNAGGLAGKAIVKDFAPVDDESTEAKESANTTFVEGSIKINGNKAVKTDGTAYTEQELKNGIEVEVPANNGTTTVSFTVKVNEGETGTVINTAIVNDTIKDTPTNKVKNPIVTHVKTVDKAVARINEELLYTITVTNTGEVDGEAIVNDGAPEGTTFVKESIKINGVSATKVVDGQKVALEESDLINGIKVAVEANNGTATVTFKVTVNANITKSPVRNTAIVNGEETKIPTETKIVTDYRVEYYYNGKADSDRYDPHTEQGEEYQNIEVGTEISQYIQKPTITKADNTVEQYKFNGDNLGNNKLVLVGDPEQNVIKVYYQKPILEVTKNANKEKATYNDTIKYTIKVKNKSDVDTEINLSDPLPRYVTYVDGSIAIANNEGKDQNATYGCKDNTITYKGILKANKTLTLTFNVKVNETAQAVIKEGIENVVTVTEECGGTYSASEVTDIYKQASVDVTKTLDLILVLDCSNSMEEKDKNGNVTGSIIPSLKTASTDVINKLFADGKPTDSTISLITYGDTATTYGTFTYDQKSELLSTLSGAIKLSGNTHIQDALKHTNKVLSGMSADRRKVVLFMSDGAPTFWSSDATSPEVEIIEGSGNTNWPKFSWVKDTFTDNTRQKILAEIKTLHGYKKTTVYSVGFNVDSLSTKYIQYVEEKGAYKNQTGANDIFNQKKTMEYEGKTYYYTTEKEYATYVLNNISTEGNYISTSDLKTTFNNIINSLIESEKTIETKEGTNTISISETRTITGKVSVTIGSKTTEYTLDQLSTGSGKNGLTYKAGVGFTWTINQDRFTKTLKIKYQVNAE